MVTPADIRDSAVATQIHALQRAAYAIEADRIGCTDFPPLNEAFEMLQSSRDCFVVFVEEERIIGCLSYEWIGVRATITRLVVSPQYFRRGVASALLRILETRLPAGTIVCASTADLNEAAIRVYDK